MSKHTPGAIRAAELVKETIIAGNGDLNDLATLIEEQTGLPDLLEACQLLLEALEGNGNINKRSQPIASGITYHKILKAAIAKAEGGN